MNDSRSLPWQPGVPSLCCAVSLPPAFRSFLLTWLEHYCQWVFLQWQPIIEDRQFVKWLVKPASGEERMRARRLTAQQVGIPNSNVDDWFAVCAEAAVISQLIVDYQWTRSTDIHQLENTQLHMPLSCLDRLSLPALMHQIPVTWSSSVASHFLAHSVKDSFAFTGN